LLGESDIDNLYVATGTKRDGLFMSPMIGDYMSKLILFNHNEFLNSYKPCRVPHKIIPNDDLKRIKDKYKQAYLFTHKER
jgi:glycine/D-amino acid oxidase-like deaminating enzyme